MSALTPALIAAGGGSVMYAGIYLAERRRDEAMRASRERLSLRFPLGLGPASAQVALQSLAGLSHHVELVFEVAVTPEGIAHGLFAPKAVRGSVVSGLRAAMPSLRIGETAAPADGRSRIALRLFVPTPCVLSTEHPETTLRTLAGLPLRDGERVVVRLAARPGSARPLAAAEPGDQAARRVERAWREKASKPGFQVAGLALVQAASPARANELAGHLTSIWRSRRGLVAALRLTSERSGRPMGALPQTKRTSGWLGADELVPLLMLPLGDTAIAGVEVTGRELPVPRDLGGRGRRLFVGRDAFGREQDVVLDESAARQHLVVVGKTGAGKSVLTAGGVLSDVEHGHGGAVIDPKADLIASILERIPPEHTDRIVVLDPGDDTRDVAAIDLLHSGDPDACTDVLVRTFKAMFPDWGHSFGDLGTLGSAHTLCAARSHAG